MTDEHTPQPAHPPHDRTQPSNPADRIVSIDVIRGIAIAGILLININFFLRQAGQTEDPAGTDAVIWQIVDDVALGKFHFVFAFLFGTGVHIFLTRLRAKGRSRWVYVRRMVILVIAGLINSALGGIDVLASYGVLALLLLPLTLLPRWSFVSLGVLAAVIPDLLQLITSVGGVDLHLPSLLLPLLSFARTLGHMMLGFWLAGLGLYSATTRVPVAALFVLSLVGSIPLWIWTNSAGVGSTDAHEIAFRTAMIPGFMYVTGLILLLRTEVGRICLSFLRLYGRMAFSNYLGQTVICVLVFPLLTALGYISAPLGLGIWAVIVVFQCAFSTFWLRHFRYGPLEWVWRCGTYWQITPLRIAETPRP
ncbi:DUF418 domain-containing protein [Brevibacterium atlanticum]|uniref:DUF418 domain-containing protein n=1 Tax=Brevibacterium atlanticum TaxID=2697563 RepID=UPI00141F7D7A|nr:DUF418 domain-containing protein [Brevibacterium atlanticum]